MTTLVRALAALGLVFVAWLMGGSKSREDVVREPIVRLAVKHPWLTAGAMAAGVLVIAAVMVISGVVPIKASSGHWAITSAFLDFAKTRSVSTHAWGVDVPPLDDEALVLRGAGHYESGCLPCHGGPGRRLPLVMAAMTPPPPELTNRIARWAPAELFSIVKHGIKFTGMPAWPSLQRDDEVWAMVAFLRRMPPLDAASYRRFAYGDDGQRADGPDVKAGLQPPPPAVRDVCWRCHALMEPAEGPEPSQALPVSARNICTRPCGRLQIGTVSAASWAALRPTSMTKRCGVRRGTMPGWLRARANDQTRHPRLGARRLPPAGSPIATSRPVRSVTVRPTSPRIRPTRRSPVNTSGISPSSSGCCSSGAAAEPRTRR
jgi:mono/diheme cytochrome c family protein